MTANSPAYAGTTCGSSGDYGAAKDYLPSGNSSHGSRAYIETTDERYLCTGLATNLKQGYVELHGYDTSGHLTGWADMGYSFFGGNGVSQLHNVYFAEWCKTPSTSCTRHEWGSPVTSVAHRYAVDYFASDQHLHFLLDGVDTGYATSWDPTVWWTNLESAWGESADNTGTDIYGTSSDTTLFTGTQYKRGTDLNWYTPTGYTSQDRFVTRFCWMHTNLVTAGSDFYAWTDPVNHVC